MVKYDLLTENYREGVVECLARSFFENDVLGVALGIGLWDWRNFFCEAVGKSIEDKLSIVALDDDKIIGANLSYNFERYSPDDYNIIRSFIPISEFMNCLYEDYDVHGRVLHFSYVGVIPGYLKKGIAFEMANRNIELARSECYDRIILEASSPYSQINAFKLDFGKVKEIFYKNFKYKDENVFGDIFGVNSCMLMELKL
jgi:GNAT superfamily N-acetyltransferase